MAVPASARDTGADRPNILWITCEDISPYLGCYGFEQARTPNLDALAAGGVRFTRAYANGPVCAVARSTLLNGMYASTIGTQHMRSSTVLPKSIPAYPQLFREAGYFCTNNSKTDYNSNFEGKKKLLWDECGDNAHWKHRPKGRPFFSVFNIFVTHESQLSGQAINGYVKRGEIPKTPRINPKDIGLPPYHPDLPEIRMDWARLHDLITLMDRNVGQRLKEIKDAGLADDTIVFFYADHGGMLSRSKRYSYNGGTQVPMIVYVPEKWRRLAPGKPGTTFDEIAQFVDLPKTVLSLAGIKVPEIMQGKVLFGPGKEPAAQTAHFYRDRMGERYDFSRAVTDGRYYLIRNFMPHRPLGRDSRYGFTVQANWRVWERWYDENPEAADPVRSQFFKPKPVVELFDNQSDPWQVHNLAKEAGQQERLRKMEADLDQWMVETRDTGLIPEPLFRQLIGKATLYDYAQSQAYPVERILGLAKTASTGDSANLPRCLDMLGEAHPVVRHWGAYGLFLLRDSSAGVKDALRKMMVTDEFEANRVMAAQALALCGDPAAAFEAIMKEARTTQDGYVFLFALNALQYGHIDDRITKENWEEFKTRKCPATTAVDYFGWEGAQRIVQDALALWPQHRKVD